MIRKKEARVYLVTGGCGFIGSHIAEALVQKGEKVKILDNLTTGCEENIASFRQEVDLIVGDIRDEGLVNRVTEGVKGVFHEAALVSVGLSVESPRLNHDINVQGTFNVLEAARRNGIRRVVCASSAAVYGDDPRLPKKENYEPVPASPYGASKAMNEMYGSLYTRLYGVETVSLRYFNVYGERQDPASPYSGVLSLFKKAFEEEEPSI
ncbi:MAG TPA: SDR family NAD(P)-dependent oxidoreductase, partial [Firmicutes bacterium]|nr:SDR family NAD(P)-dependent oxidoreductase [Bacillota bacterium]